MSEIDAGQRAPVRILGIDPGSRITGWGVIDMQGNRARHVASGFLQLRGETMSERLYDIFQGIAAVIRDTRPQEAVVERIFMHRNADSALKLGQARGAAICAVVENGLALHEYSPTQIKQATVGKGNAGKEQVQHMVRVLLNLVQTPQADCADALAAALCHGHTRQTLRRMQASAGGGETWQFRR